MKQIKLVLQINILLNLSLFVSCQKKSDSGIRDQSIFQNVEEVSKNERKNQGKENKYSEYLPSSTTNQIVKHDFYTLSYNEKFEQSEWVYYELKKRFVVNGNFSRPFFIEDPKVKTESANWRNYKKSGYDKGHLCPAGDMEFDIKAYNDTFYTSNISPQDHNFNAGVWNRLEEKIRYWAIKYDGIYVVTGGVLEASLKTIGKEKVLVPNYFYKILLDDSNGKYKMIAFLIPNEKSNKPLYDFVVSVDSIEKMTGINFFPKLQDSIEENLEKSSDYKNWSFD